MSSSTPSASSSSSSPATTSASGVPPPCVLHTCAVSLYKHSGLKHSMVGQRGAAIVAMYTGSSPEAQQLVKLHRAQPRSRSLQPQDWLTLCGLQVSIVFYHIRDGGQQLLLDSAVAPVPLSATFAFVPRSAQVVTLADERGEFWSLSFRSSDQLDAFARQVALAKDLCGRLSFREWERHHQPPELPDVPRRASSSQVAKLHARYEQEHQQYQLARSRAMFELWPLTRQGLALSELPPQDQGDDLEEAAPGDAVMVRYAVFSCMEAARSSRSAAANQRIVAGLRVAVSKRIASVGGYLSEDPAAQQIGDVFVIGDGSQLKGIEQGVLGMHKDQRKFVVIPPHYRQSSSTVWEPLVDGSATVAVEMQLAAILTEEEEEARRQQQLHAPSSPSSSSSSASDSDSDSEDLAPPKPTTTNTTLSNNMQVLLRELELEQFVEAFEREHIDVDDLTLLTDEDLKHLVPALGPRRRLERYLESKRRDESRDSSMQASLAELERGMQTLLDRTLQLEAPDRRHSEVALKKEMQQMRTEGRKLVKELNETQALSAKKDDYIHRLKHALRSKDDEAEAERTSVVAQAKQYVHKQRAKQREQTMHVVRQVLDATYSDLSSSLEALLHSRTFRKAEHADRTAALDDEIKRTLKAILRRFSEDDESDSESESS